MNPFLITNAMRSVFLSVYYEDNTLFITIIRYYFMSISNKKERKSVIKQIKLTLIKISIFLGSVLTKKSGKSGLILSQNDAFPV